MSCHSIGHGINTILEKCYHDPEIGKRERQHIDEQRKK